MATETQNDMGRAPGWKHRNKIFPGVRLHQCPFYVGDCVLWHGDLHFVELPSHRRGYVRLRPFHFAAPSDAVLKHPLVEVPVAALRATLVMPWRTHGSSWHFVRRTFERRAVEAQLDAWLAAARRDALGTLMPVVTLCPGLRADYYRRAIAFHSYGHVEDPTPLLDAALAEAMRTALAHVARTHSALTTTTTTTLPLT